MSNGIIRIAVEEGLELLPAVQAIVEASNPQFRITVCKREKMRAACADVLLLEADANGVQSLKLPAWWPGHERILLMKSGATQADREEAVLKGNAGVIDKSASASLIVKAVTCVARGELWLDRRTAGKVFERLCLGIVRKRRWSALAASVDGVSIPWPPAACTRSVCGPGAESSIVPRHIN